MTHRACRSRARTGHRTATGPVTPTCSWDRWGRAETERTALGEALVMRRRTRVRFPPPPLWGLGEMPGSSWRKAGATANSGGPGFVLSGWSSHAQAALPGPQSSTSPSPVVYAGLSRVTQVWLAAEPRDAVGVRKRGAELLRCQMRRVSWAHMASSTRFRAPSLRMRLARWALTVLGVM